MAHEEVSRQAMRDLWFKSDAFIRENGIPVSRRREFLMAETEAGLEVSKIEDALQVKASFEKFVGGRACDVTVRVEFSPDMRELPEVYEDWDNGRRSGTSTTKVADFKKVADELAVLFDPISSESAA